MTELNRDDLMKMSVEELQALRKKRLKEAKDNIRNLCIIARCLGDRLSETYGPKYRFKESFIHGTVEIYVDDYGQYMTTKYNEKVVVSTGSDGQYIAGPWEAVLSRIDEAKAKIQAELNAAEVAEKQRLIDLLVL